MTRPSDREIVTAIAALLVAAEQMRYRAQPADPTQKREWALAYARAADVGAALNGRST